MVVLDSERSDECIDFTMMCVFYFFCVSVYTIIYRNIFILKIKYKISYKFVYL